MVRGRHCAPQISVTELAFPYSFSLDNIFWLEFDLKIYE